MYGYEILHEEIMENLINNIRCERAQHAYIFEGREGVGNLEAAKLFANALVCQEEKTAPCTLCPSCLMAAADTHPDIYYVTTSDNKDNILVGTIRDVCTDAYTKPFESKNKVYIIKNEMNEQAQNAFLKLLEEPPEYAVFIILTENSEGLLETIRSRCTLIRFAPSSIEKIKNRIQKSYPENTSDIDFLAKYSDGIWGNVEKILAQENFVQLRDLSLEYLPVLLSCDLSDAFKIAVFIEENKDNADSIFLFWQKLLRDILLIQNDNTELVLNSDKLSMLINLSNRYDEKKIMFAIDRLLLAQKMKKRYASLRTLCLALAFSIKRNKN